MINTYCSDFDYSALKTSSAGILLRLTFNRFTSLFVSVLLHQLVLLFFNYFLSSPCLILLLFFMSLPLLYRSAYSAKIRLSPPGCALLSSFISSSPRRGGCHSSVLPNKQAEEDRERKKKKRREKGCEGEMEDRN